MANKEAFAIWVTGLPASGKSTLTKALATELAARGIEAAVLESDELRKIFTPQPRYDEEERERFYRQMAYVGGLLVKHGVAVIFDATANRRAYRQGARDSIARFLEVYVNSPLQVCIARDPKGIYRGASKNVPGRDVRYEPPESPEVIVRGDRETAEVGAQRVIEKLAELEFLQSGRDRPRQL